LLDKVAIMNKVLLLLLVAVLAPFTVCAGWIPLNNNKAPETPPKVTVLSDDQKSTVIKIELNGFDLRDFSSDGKIYQAVDLLTETSTSEPGYPELPYLANILAIPDRAAISLEILEIGETSIFSNISLPPSRASLIEGSPEPPYEENARAYQSDRLFPSEYVKADPPAIFRDFRIARIAVFPVHYLPARKELQVVSSITVRVNYGDGEVVNPKTTARKAIAPSFGKIYRSFILNYQQVLESCYGGREEGRELILCIMPDIFVESFKVYADWKRQSGIDVHITKFTDIGANAYDPDIIKNHIADAYHNWEYPPTYVLIVGDDGVFPKKIVVYPDYSFPNEDYFVEIDGDDYFPEMMIGRFTNEVEYRMQVMIHKLLLYEKEPFIQDPTWFKKGTCCSNNAYPSQPETKRFAYHKMKDDGNFLSVDTMMSDGGYGGYGCSFDLEDVTSAINNGRSFLNYRGEGWYDGWHANCYYFSVSDVSALTNGQKFPFVTSIGCGVAMFDVSGGNCFGEEWMEMGSMTAPRGAAAFLGPTSNTHTAYNNTIDKGIYTGMFDEGLETPGQALLRGKFYMYSIFGNDYYTQYHFKIYCCLGDPSIHIWKTLPYIVNVNHPSTIPVGASEVEFTVKRPLYGTPVPNAVVCVTGDEVFATGTTDSAGVAVVTITSTFEDTLTVTVRGANVIPHQDTIRTILYDVYIEPADDPVLDDLDGNNDGLVNPNENCSVTYTLVNWGVGTAYNVQASLSTLDTDYVSIVTADPVNFGNIYSSGTVTGSPFQIFIKPDCPVGRNFTLELHIACDSSSWDYSNEENVKGCKINLDNFVIYDPCASPNMNFRLDPGETDVVVLSVKNTGEDIAPDMMGILRSDDTFIIVSDSVGSFGNVNIGDLAMNMENVFMVSVSPSCPTGYMAAFTLKAYTQGGNYPYQTLTDFEIPVSRLIPADYTGPDSYGYYAYSSDDSFYDQTPVFDWVELEGIGTQLGLPLISDYTATVSIPFPFKYYGVNYNQVRISTDGWMAFGSGTETAPVNKPLPNNDNINNMVGVFWDDLYDNEFFMGNIVYFNDYFNHRFIIEWDSISHNTFSSSPVKEYFEAILLDPAYYPTATGDGDIIVQYRLLSDISSNTIGIENQTQDIGLQYVYNADYDPTASVLTDGTAIRFTTEPPFANILTGEGDFGNKRIKPGQGIFFLAQNHPNPFNSYTRIDYSIPEQGRVILNVYDIRGELVRTLFDGKQPAGTYSIEWNSLNDGGIPVSPGVYFCRLQTDNYSGTLKMFLLK
jgi:hypothetical protein